MAIKPTNLSEGAFSKAESGMKINKIGDGGFNFDLHGPATPGIGGKGRSGKVQSPAQHASVEKAAKASAGKRKKLGSF